jgi:hypothetical protein
VVHKVELLGLLAEETSFLVKFFISATSAPMSSIRHTPNPPTHSLIKIYNGIDIIPTIPSHFAFE